MTESERLDERLDVERRLRLHRELRAISRELRSQRGRRRRQLRMRRRALTLELGI